MAKPSSPSPPHGKGDKRHVDIRGRDQKDHVKVKDNLGATAVGGYMRDQERKAKGRS
jgi:hypothetical protein